MKIVCTIEARMRSSRLPNKVMLPILGRPMLELMIERLRRVPQIDDIVIATAEHESCRPIVDLANQLGVHSYRGSEEDVLARVLEAAQSVNGDLIVETTGDCPLIDPQIVSKVIEAFNGKEVDYCSNTLEHTFPLGMAVQVFPTSVLEEVASLTDDPADREHVSLFIYEHPEKFRLANVTSGLSPDQADFRLTVDTPEDFTLIRKIFERLYPTDPEFGLGEIIALLESEPEYRLINQDIVQKPVR